MIIMKYIDMLYYHKIKHNNAIRDGRNNKIETIIIR